MKLPNKVLCVPVSKPMKIHEKNRILQASMLNIWSENVPWILENLFKKKRTVAFTCSNDETKPYASPAFYKNHSSVTTCIDCTYRL